MRKALFISAMNEAFLYSEDLFSQILVIIG